MNTQERREALQDHLFAKYLLRITSQTVEQHRAVYGEVLELEESAKAASDMAIRAVAVYLPDVPKFRPRIVVDPDLLDKIVTMHITDEAKALMLHPDICYKVTSVDPCTLLYSPDFRPPAILVQVVRRDSEWALVRVPGSALVTETDGE